MIWIAELRCAEDHVIATSVCEAVDTEDEEVCRDMASTAECQIRHGLIEAKGTDACPCGAPPRNLQLAKSNFEDIAEAAAWLAVDMAQHAAERRETRRKEILWNQRN